MIEKILISHQTVMNDNSPKVLVTNMRLNFDYYIKVQIIPIEDITEEFVSCQLRIINMSKAKEELLLHKFYNNCSLNVNYALYLSGNAVIDNYNNEFNPYSWKLYYYHP